MSTKSSSHQKKNTPRLQLENVSSHKYIVNVTDHPIEVIFMSNYIPIISILKHVITNLIL